MRTGVDSLLGRVAEFAHLDPTDAEASATSAIAGQAAPEKEVEAASESLAHSKKAATQAAGGTSTVKSVRIALARLDRMMNTVGELVINRTRMVGRVAELGKPVGTLSFSKEQLEGKGAEVHDKQPCNPLTKDLHATK